MTLNDADEWNVSDGELAAKCGIGDAPRVFFGEKYVRDTLHNTDPAVEKLGAAYQRYREASTGAAAAELYTKRNFASGQVRSGAGTLQVGVSPLYSPSLRTTSVRGLISS